MNSVLMLTVTYAATAKRVHAHENRGQKGCPWQHVNNQRAHDCTETSPGSVRTVQREQVEGMLEGTCKGPVLGTAMGATLNSSYRKIPCSAGYSQSKF